MFENQDLYEDRVVQTNVQPAGTKLVRFTRANAERGTESHEIPFQLLNPSRIVMQVRRVPQGQPNAGEPILNPDGTPKYWRNEMADVIEKAPGSDRVYIQRGVILLNAIERFDTIPGLDCDPETGEVYDLQTLVARVTAFAKASAQGATAESPDFVAADEG
jgi:hypothetical protein